MNRLLRCLGASLAVAGVVMFSPQASATIVSVGGLAVNDQGQFSTVAGVTTVNFNALSDGTQNFSVGLATYQADIFRCASCTGSGDLLDDTTKGARAEVGTPLTIDFSRPLRYFGLYWGSPDPGNLITFFNGITPVFALTGANLNAAFGVGFGLDNAAYVNFAAGTGESYTRIVLSSTDFPFETDNHAFAAVPEPGSLFLFGSGVLGLLASIRRRKTRRASTV
jgi:hypothetical protein